MQQHRAEQRRGNESSAGTESAAGAESPAGAESFARIERSADELEFRGSVQAGTCRI